MRERLSGWLPAERRERMALMVLLTLLAAGIALRLWLTLAIRPAVIGYADSYVYIGAANGALFEDPLRPAGYPIFLRLLHALNTNLSFTIVVQHALGLASALLLYLAARRVGVSRWWSLLPAAVVALAGPQIMIEHAPLTDGLFVFLQSGALYAAARAVGRRDWVWALVAGILVGAGVTVRNLGVLLLGALVLCTVAAPPANWSRRLARGGATLAAACVLVGAYVIAQEHDTGFVGLTRGGEWNLYGRVAPFADCDRFDPPQGTRQLCGERPESTRPGPNSYIFDPRISPAIKAFGTPFEASDEDTDRVGAFARAALLHQPFDWLDHVVTEDLPRYVSSNRGVRPGAGLGYDGLQDSIVYGFQGPQTAALLSTYYTTSGQSLHQGRFDAFFSYERATRVSGVLFVLLAVLALLGAFMARGALRRGALLFGVVALVSILGPPLTLFYDARYAIPAYGPLAAAAAVGGAALTEWIRQRRASRGEAVAQA